VTAGRLMGLMRWNGCWDTGEGGRGGGGGEQTGVGAWGAWEGGGWSGLWHRRGGG
jgi:hypothetical protein